MKIPSISLLVIAVSFVLLPSFASAHHSFAATFDRKQVTELEGEITKIQWRNPHIRFSLLTIDDQGQERIYDIEGHALSIMRRMGVSKDAISDGDKVRVAGHPAIRKPDSMFVLNVLLPTNEEIVLDPMGTSRWTENIGTTEIWQASQDDAQAQNEGIFTMWSTTFADPNGFPFPEIFDLSLVYRYPLTDVAKEALAAFNPETDLPTQNCAPKGMPTIMEQPYPMELIDQGDTLLLRMEEYDMIRTIYMDETEPREDIPDSLLGYSTGHWDGNSLVVRTTDTTWRHFNTVGIPLSEGAGIVERFTPSENGKRLDYSLTVTDDRIFTEPVEVTKFWLSLPGTEIKPYECIL
jgi:hypothetical protein